MGVFEKEKNRQRECVRACVRKITKQCVRLRVVCVLDCVSAFMCDGRCLFPAF